MMDTFRMIAVPGLSHENRQDRYFRAGQTVGGYLRELGWQTDGLTARVFIDGQLIPDAEWLAAEPKPGQAVVVRRVYTGGGRGNTGKQIGMIIGMLAIAVGAAFAAPAIAGALGGLGAGIGGGTFFGGMLATGSPLIQAGLTIAGSLAMNAHIPPSRPRRALPPPRRELKEAA